jgi:hypothetical protein
MFITLQRILERLSHKATKEYRHEVWTREGNCFRARGFRDTFINGFLGKLEMRYRAERQSVASECTALVRVNKAEAAVEDYLKQKVKKEASSLSMRRGWNQEGYKRGQAAADRVNLKSNAMSTTEVKSLKSS